MRLVCVRFRFTTHKWSSLNSQEGMAGSFYIYGIKYMRTCISRIKKQQQAVGFLGKHTYNKNTGIFLGDMNVYDDMTQWSYSTHTSLFSFWVVCSFYIYKTHNIINFFPIITSSLFYSRKVLWWWWGCKGVFLYGVAVILNVCVSGASLVADFHKSSFPSPAKQRVKQYKSLGQPATVWERVS